MMSPSRAPCAAERRDASLVSTLKMGVIAQTTSAIRASCPSRLRVADFTRRT
jgi:hypothetical protein